MESWTGGASSGLESRHRESGWGFDSLALRWSRVVALVPSRDRLEGSTGGVSSVFEWRGGESR